MTAALSTAISLAPDEARKLVLQSQRIFSRSQSGAAVDATLALITHLGYIQIDTISVVQRAHHHVLWSRNPRYRLSHIDQLQASGRVLEYWAHAAAYLPMQDYRFCLPTMQAHANGQPHRTQRDRKMMCYVLDRIRDQGALQSRDFADTASRSRAMWEWKPAKQALKQLFMEGRLLSPRRIGFQKVYDLPQRVLPDGLDQSMPTETEYARHLITRFLCANGIGLAAEIGYLRKHTQPLIRATLQDMLEAGDVIAVDVGRQPYYALPDSLAQLHRRHTRTGVKILSPFDNLLIQRRRLQSLFDFSYQIECYLPAAQRRFGYFCLPVLQGAQVVGRLDAKAHRQTATLSIRQFYLEKPLRRADGFLSAFAQQLHLFMRFNACERVHLENANLPAAWQQELRRLLA